MATVNRQVTAVVAITAAGAELGRTIRALMPGTDLFVIRKFARQDSGDLPFSSLSQAFANRILAGHRQIVLIMATGIAVRLAAPFIKDKRSDPGIVVLDDCGNFAVSLLSGHAGGANALALRLASLTGARPVITTASDGRGLLSPDMLAARFDWSIPDTRYLAHVSAALVNGDKVGIFQDTGQTDWQPGELGPRAILCNSLEDLRKSGCKAAVIISDRAIDVEGLGIPAAVCRPRTLVTGIGCNRGTTVEEIEGAVRRLFEEHGLSMESIGRLATTGLKRDEEGITSSARKLRVPVDYYDNSQLAAVECPSAPSGAALKHIGLPSVCEAAAILSSGSSLIVPKKTFNRRITLAVARCTITAPQRTGRLSIVGIGPGSPEHMTLKARQAIAQADCVVGYSTYIDLIRPLLSGKEVITSSMGKEVERAGRAVDLAAQGRSVCLVSSGDPGIYGMAGLALEMAEAMGPGLEIETVPGVTAAQAAASLLGAPLNVDTAFISLSDHLVPWEGIIRRLRCAAQSDFVIALYNPRSRARKNHLAEAVEAMLESRSPSTPVGIVNNAFREGQQVSVTSLGSLPCQEVGMDSIVIVGNSTTRVSGGRLLTPRGYSDKYDLQAEKRRR